MYQLYKSFTGTANAGAQVQAIRSGRIVGVQWAIGADLDSDLETFVIELSLVPIYQSATNDAKGVISAMYGMATGTPAGVTSFNAFFPVDVPVQAGQLIYLNGTLATTTDVRALCLLSVR